MTARIIRIKPIGRMGNQMFQLMLAEKLRLAIRQAKIVGYSLPQWNLVGDPPPEDMASLPLLIKINKHVVPLDQIIAQANSADQVDITINTLCLRYAYYQTLLDHYRKLFRYKSQSPVKAGLHDLVICVRLGDILSGVHANYMPLPISWYEDLIRQTALNPVFIGEIGTDPYSEALKRRFPKARFVMHADPMDDFDFIRNAAHIVIGVGTFSWLAAWLSETARRIYFPIVGLFNPIARPDIDLLPADDRRYRFFESAMRQWWASPAQLDHVLNSEHDFRKVSRHELTQLFGPHIGTYGAPGAAAP